jgi:hypothetical protein
MDNLQVKTAIESLSDEIHATAVNKGWWNERDNAIEAMRNAGLHKFGVKLVISQCLLLAHSEISEGVEGMRGDLKDDKCPEFDMVVVEAADAIIRLLDVGRAFGWPLAAAIIAKVEMNKGREYKHGGKAF